MYAIVATGGKQLKVVAGDVVTVEKLDAAAGENVKFDVIFLDATASEIQPLFGQSHDGIHSTSDIA